jgi:uncharacterized protein YgiM (DUF1202 family)
MKQQTLWLLSIVLLISLFSINEANPATVETQYGPREGRVIARIFEEIIVTIITNDNRIFQYDAKQIKKITAKSNLLLAKTTVLLEKPDPSSETVAELALGLEVIILEDNENSEWVHIRAWGAVEGWIPRDVLTNEVVFTNDVQPIKLDMPVILPRDESPIEVPVPINAVTNATATYIE